ncbi:hypothetical protein NQ314_005655 [Rhamnusium bicolor]|uniref:Nuclear pore complex protein Nup153 n=1 Tax=Rhamnusium bicolor TaxID=1586634 RepID=A0AAV8ZGT5_9CUCU|nr:hypothetical protein NQ314_005655 [Rhamnusium bicolor]
MEKDLNDSADHNSLYLKESETDKSFVGKFKSIINNTPLSKWFRKQDDNRSTIRRHDEVFEDEEICEMQPPSKRVKLPGGNEGNNCSNILFNEPHTTPVTNNIDITNKTFNSFSEPVAGPSGIKSRKLLSNATTVSTNRARNTFSSNELLNGHKDSDSEESTSGYSSVARIGSKEQVCGSHGSSKQTSPIQNSPSNSKSMFHTSNASMTRSLFAERSLSPNMNTSLSSRRPSFNASTFGSPNFVDKTISTKRIINSPFYNGQTIYGGASAYGRKLGRSSQDLKTSLRHSVQIKPVNKTAENGNLVLGKTARRILDTLEQYSSPINDAKKIPITPKKLRHDGLLTKYTGANPYMIRESKVTSNKELQVPSVSDLLKMKHKTRLQDSTEAVRQIATSSKSDLNTECYKINTSENKKEKHIGKIKTKIASVRQKQASNETVDEVNLNPVSLPITTLPKFDFIIPPPDQVKQVPENPTQSIKQIEPSPTSKSDNAQFPHNIIETEKNVQIGKQTSKTTLTEYKFSEPLVIAENIKSIVALNDFKFSDPLCKKSKTDSSSNVKLNFNMPENKLPSLVPKKTKKNSETSVKAATTLKTGSVMDILGKKDENSLMEKFKPAQGTWECSACMIRNQPEKTKCVACKTPKLVPIKQTENEKGFGSQFKMTSDKWECSTCMVRNNNSEDKCVACTTPKPNTNSMPKELNVKNITPLYDFGDKFKPPSNSWECTVCLIRNKSELIKCVACETPNPKLTIAVSSSSNFGNKFQSPSNSWECTSCLIRNKEESSKCVACETPKSGQKSTSTGFGNSFKVKDDEWECGVCMVRNKITNIKCQCCDTAKPGSVSNTSTLESNGKNQISSFIFGIDKASATSFSFGIPSTTESSTTKTETNASSIFGTNSAVATAAPATFSFGIPAEPQDKPATAESTKSTESAKTPILQISNPLPKSNEKLPEKSETSASLFKFGVSSPAPPSSNKEAAVEKSDTLVATVNSDTTKPTFNFKPTTTNGDIDKSGVLFGNKQDTASNSAAFNPTSASSANLFNFGAKPAATATPLAPTPATQSSQTEAAKPLFNFGSNNHSTVKSAIPSFGLVKSTGSSLNNGFGSTNTPSFGTTNTSSFEAPMTSSSEVKPFTFNNTTTTSGEPASKAPMFSFGQSAGSANTTTKTSGFNFASTSTPAFNFTVGKTETPSFNAPPASNTFGLAASTSGKNGTFNFGNMASSNNNQKAGFSFGAAINNTTAPPTQSAFSFGAAAATPASSSGGFNFTGAAPTFNAATRPSFNFTDGSVTAFSMEWGVNENRIAVIALFKCGKSQSEIFEVLKPLPISRMFVYRAIKRYDELSGIQDRERSGRPRTVRTPNVKAVRKRLRRNPLRKEKILSREMNVSTRTMSRIVRDDLNMRAYRRSTGHLLPPALKEIRLARAKRFLQWHERNGHENILFTDEKIFTIEESYNRQNDKIYAHSSEEAKTKIPRVQRGHHPSSVIVWWGVSYQGVTKIHFCEQGVKTGARSTNKMCWKVL